jgi:dihydrofolate reductase
VKTPYDTATGLGLHAPGAANKNIWVVGGGDLAGQFHGAGPLDEAILQVASVSLGQGKPIIPRRLLTQAPWRPLSARQTGAGFAELRCALPNHRSGVG